MKDELASFVADFELTLDDDERELWRLEQIQARADVQADLFGIAVREARLALGLTQVELAAKSGVQQREISRIEKCIANPTLKTVDKIMRALNGQVVFSFIDAPALASTLSVAPLKATA